MWLPERGLLVSKRSKCKGPGVQVHPVYPSNTKKVGWPGSVSAEAVTGGEGQRARSVEAWRPLVCLAGFRSLCVSRTGCVCISLRLWDKL